MVGAAPLVPYPRAVSVPRGALGAKLALFLGLSVLTGVIAAALALPPIALVGLTAKRGSESFEALPAVLATPALKQRTRILASDGTVIARFYSENRVYVPIKRIAPVMQRAIVAIEDSRFYEHNGVDVRGTLRALVANSRAGGVTQGGSTLTQQYVKNVLVATATTKAARDAASADTVARKLQEARYALGLEQRWSKEQILEGYLNIAYFGAGAYGIEAAAQRYFGRSAKRLTLGQAATLAGIVRAPSSYDPIAYPADSQARRNFVLQRMVDLGMADPGRAAAAATVPMRRLLHPHEVPNRCTTSIAPFFCDYVYSTFLADPAFGKTVADRRQLFNGGGLTIRTTLDLHAQRAAQRAVDTYIPPKDPSRRVAAIAMVEPGTGNIVAMAQNRRYGEGPGRTYVNNVVDARYDGTTGQQAGSTFKIFTLAAAIEKGIPISTRIYSPVHTEFPGGSFTNCEGAPLNDPWPVTNSTTSYNASFDMRSGAALSVNTFFAELERRVGLCDVVDAASRAGIHDAYGHDPLRDTALQVQSFTLGVTTISPLTLADAYATFAARGQHCEPRAIASATSAGGGSLDVAPPLCQQVFEPAVADAVNEILSEVVDGPNPYRTGAQMSLGRPAAGKTGTTTDHVAVWFAGYTPDLAAAVWCGHPDAPADFPMSNVTINGTYYPEVFGYLLPGPIWKQAMLGALEGVSASSFAPIDPSLLVGEQRTVPSVSGMTQEAAVKALTQAGFVPIVATEAVDSYEEAGLVAYTDPRSGSTSTSGTTVTIYLSNGVPPPPSPSPTPTSSHGPSSSPTPTGTPSAEPTKTKPPKPKHSPPGHQH